MASVIRQGSRTLYPGTPAFDAAWHAMQLDKAPKAWQGRIRAKWAGILESGSLFDANTFLRVTGDALGSMLLPLSASDDDLRARADALAVECFGAGALVGARGLVDYWRACEGFVVRKGLTPPEVKDGEECEIRGAVARMVCPLWWRRQLRREHGRAIEKAAVRLGYVHLKADKYVSNVNVWRRQAQKRRNADALAAVQVENQFGDAFTLADLAERSNANPRIRRAELMTRIAGFERVAKELGHVAEFWTGTAPSKYHAIRSQDGQENPAWLAGGQLTPRDAQQHLGKCWARFRAWAHRKGVRFYGFRIAEPHHDGCPHWHLLLFMPRELSGGRSLVARVRAGFRRYFLKQHDANEPGARKNRVKFVSIDMERGSAAGYVIKYVSKNIDGYGVQRDLFGHDAVEGSQRVEAWAATWGIRQFQQIGGAPVGVWRELRRLQASEEHTDKVGQAQAAADAGDWQAYTILQGGPTVARADLAIEPARSIDGERWCPVAGCPVPAPRTRYGEAPKGAVFGVRDVRKERAFVTRRFKWEVKRGRDGIRIGGSSGGRGGVGVGSDRFDGTEVGFDFQAGAAGPWTRVNNCTGGDEDVRRGFEVRGVAGYPGGRGVVGSPVGRAGGGGAGDAGGAPWLT